MSSSGDKAHIPDPPSNVCDPDTSRMSPNIPACLARLCELPIVRRPISPRTLMANYGVLVSALTIPRIAAGVCQKKPDVFEPAENA